MFHPDRHFTIHVVRSPAELAELLTGHPFPLGTGYRLRDTLFLNDSVSPSGPQVYAVVRGEYELDAIEFSACSRDEAEDYIAGILLTPTPEYPGAPHPTVAPQLSLAA